MVSIRAQFRASSVEAKTGVIYYQIALNRVIRQLKTDYKIYPCEWNSRRNSVVVDGSNSERAQYLRLLNTQILLDIRRLHQLAKLMDSKGQLLYCEDLISEYQRQPKPKTLFNYFREQIARLESLGRLGTAYNYRSTLGSFRRFRGGEDLFFDNVTSELMEEYEAYLKRESISMNSSSFYMRVLRALYNKAVDCDYVDQSYPFKRVYTGIEKTVKRALSLKNVSKIREYDLSTRPVYGYARDMFLFSFYTRGMSFVDMAYLRKSDIKGGVLSYRRRKTGQMLHVRWEACMQDIVNVYGDSGSPYLLPILHDREDSTSHYKIYRSELSKINHRLKTLADELKIPSNITMYVARHSWASAARVKNIPLAVISEGMGHDSESTTQIYLASLDTTIVDRANRLILRAL